MLTAGCVMRLSGSLIKDTDGNESLSGPTTPVELNL